MELWSSLGDDCQDRVLYRVFSECSPRESANYRLVCRQWRAASQHGVVSLSPTLLLANKLPSVFPNITSLDLSKTISTSRRWNVLLKLPKLVALRLVYLENEGMEFFPQMINLRSLDLTHASICDEKLSRLCISLPQLESLKLKGCSLLTQHGIDSLSCLKSLTLLSMESALTGLVEVDLRPLRFLKKLRVLNIDNCTAIGDGSFEAIGKISSLTEFHACLHSGQENKVTDLGFSALFWGLTNLHTLSLSCSRGYTFSSFTESGCLVHLKTFILTKADRLKDKLFPILAEMTSLQRLEIHDCIHLTTHPVMHLTTLTNLTSLLLGGGEIPIPTRVLEDDGLSCLSILPCLRVLKIGGYVGFSGKTIWKFGTLTSLHLTACCDVMDRHFTSLSSLSRLKHLSHRYCDGLTDDSIASIACIKTLETFTISGNTKMYGSTLSALCSLTSLTELRLFDCSKLQDSGIIQLASIISLKNVDFCGCQALTVYGLKKLARANPSLNVRSRPLPETLGSCLG